MSAIWLLALLHLYIGWRIAPQLPGAAAPVLFGVLLLGSLALIPAAFMGRRARDRSAADRWTWAGMLTLGLFSMLLVFTLLRDAVLFVAWLVPLPAGVVAAAAAPSPAAPSPAAPSMAATSVAATSLTALFLAQATALAVPVLAFLATLGGLAGARRTARVRHVDVPIAGLPAALQGFTIAQISDVHVGPTVKGPYVQRIVEAVNRLNADAVAVTGDLVDGRVRDLTQDVAPLAGLRSRHGTFFVTGNHEYYSGAQEWMALLSSMGLRVLTNEHVVLDHDGAALVMAGVADFSAHHFVPGHRSDPQAALAGAPRRAGLRVLLAHQPRSAQAAADAGFDVQLSGHTHGGQFWPFNLLVPLQQPFTAGLHRLRTLWVYTSRGTGYWGPPLRLGAPSEITRLRFVAASP